MTIPTTLLTDDRNQQFLDWGTEITFRQITQTFDPQTQQVTENITDTQLTAIVGPAPSTPTPGTAAQHLTGELSFQIKAEELPTTSPNPTSRILYNNTEYDITTFQTSTAAQIVLLTCRKTTN